ncbi:unnamed protein product [Danaus chrysippus]|uniref:(African queen) hypothetical protein n=1 Tax=Danaus chrysippus TaxID=151541 RepID=A0A8J2QBX9_9NEOP|nr:unnamed protein product [Danaus chrysippus]
MAKPTTQKARGRPKKQKGVQKTPTVIKVKIQKGKKSDDTEKAQDKRSELTQKDIKIMLANEGVKSIQVKKATTVPKKRGRPKKKDSAIAEVKPKKQVKTPKQQVKPRVTRSQLKVKHKSEKTAECKLNKKLREPARKEENNIVHMDEDNSESNSISSQLSWLRNISISSHATSGVTVSSNDFFTFDNKLPLVKLRSIDKKTIKNPVNRNQFNKGESISDSDSDVSVNKCVSQQISDDSNIALPSLNLSTSPCDRISMNKSEDTLAPDDKLSNILRKLSSKLRSLDHEVIDWMGHAYEDDDLDSDLTNDENFLSDFLTDERQVILTCREIKRFLLGPIEEMNKTLSYPQSDQNDCDEIIKTRQDVNTKVTDVFNSCTLIENDFDDISEDTDEEDALSLFAESVTHVDTSKRNRARAGDETEKYIPEPINNYQFKAPEVRYQPTVISNTKAVQRKLVAIPNNPKQNLVTTLMCGDRKLTNGNRAYGNQNMIINKEITCNGNGMPQAQLISSTHKPMQGVKSQVFKGVCFFYLIASCKNIVCKFPHAFIEIDDIRKRLSELSDDLFIEEYILVKSWPQLRRTYGLCFVEECRNRDLSRMLVEMAIDFIVKCNSSSKEDERLKTEVAERVLIDLNDAKLTNFTDLLTYKVQFSGVMLYEFFLSTLSKSVNFSRYKSVFLKLTVFMSDLLRAFDIDVATQLLERICMLPYDEELAIGIIEIIKKTDQTIFTNPLMDYFKKQLELSNLDLYNEFVILKNNATANSKQFERTYNKVHTEVSGPTQINSNLVNKSTITSPIDTTILNYTRQSILQNAISVNNLGDHVRREVAKNKSKQANRSKSIHSRWKNMSVFDRIRQRRFDQPPMIPRWLGTKNKWEQFPQAGPSVRTIFIILI